VEVLAEGEEEAEADPGLGNAAVDRLSLTERRPLRALAGRHAVLLAGTAAGIAFIAPLLTPGYVLSYDMVFVPRYRLGADLLGLSGQVPRSVPTEVLVATISRVVPADVLEKALLMAIFVLAAIGAGLLLEALLPDARTAARVGAGVLYAWNPFVYERLLIGHWSLLVAYAVLPFVARAVLDLRAGVPGAWRRTGLWLGVAALASPYGGVIAGVLGVLVAVRPPWQGRWDRVVRAVAGVAGLALVVNLPWLIPSVTRPGGLPSTATGLAAFGPRSDSPLGTFGSLLSLGGMWNTTLAPPTRTSWAWLPSFGVVAVVAVLGWIALARRGSAHRWAGLVAAAGLGLLLAGGTRLPGAGAVVRWTALHLPGGGLLRDSQKFLAPFALALAVGFGAGIHRLLPLGSDRRLRLAFAACLVAAAVSLTPTLAWAAGGRLVSARYPASWERAREVMEADPSTGRVLVLPWHLYFPQGWNADRVVLDPAQRFFSRAALTTERLELRSRTLPSEDPLARRADRAVDARRPLRPALSGLGVRYVLLLKEADWRRFEALTTGLPRVLDTPDLSLFRSPASARPVEQRSAPAGLVIAGDVAAAATLVACAIGLSLGAARRRRDRPGG